MRKKIILYSRDPGGANSIIPLIKPLSSKGFKVRLYGKDTALSIYKKFGYKGINIWEEPTSNNNKKYEGFLIKEKPNIIITSTSPDDFSEKHLWKAAFTLRIPTLAILDQWINYGLRFSKYGLDKAEKYAVDKSFDFLPTKIMVMDQFAKREMVNEGLPANRILVTGQPYFEFLHNHILPIYKKGVKTKAHRDFTILFASEPLSETFRDSDHMRPFWGYTEKTILQDLLEALIKITTNQNLRTQLIIKLHPKESGKKYDEFCNFNSKKSIKISVYKKINYWNLIAKSDLVCGISSMLLIESLLFDKPIISIQIGLRKKDPFILSRKKDIKSIKNRKELENQLKSHIGGYNLKSINFNHIRHPIKNIMQYIENYPWQS